MDPESDYRDERAAHLARTSGGTNAVPEVRATEYIAKMRGASRPHLLRCDDGEYYVVKFLNNPQHVRILANEMLASQLALLIGLPMPQWAFVNVPTDFVEENPPLTLEMNPRVEPCASGLRFGCRYVGDPNRVSVVDFFPDRLLKWVGNLDSAFPGPFVFDKRTCNCDGRQVVFFRSVLERGRPYGGLSIDQGLCFNGQYQSLPDDLICSFYPRRVVYEHVRGLGSCEPHLSRTRNIEPEQLDVFACETPWEWCSEQPERCSASSKDSTKGGSSSSEPLSTPRTVTSHLFSIGAADCCPVCQHRSLGPRHSFTQRVSQISRTVACLRFSHQSYPGLASVRSPSFACEHWQGLVLWVRATRPRTCVEWILWPNVAD